MSTQGQVITPGSMNGRAQFGAPGTDTVESFGAIERRAKHETAAEVLAAQAKATIQARYIVAIDRPRDEDRVRQRILHDCERTSFAESALYQKPVGTKTLTGLSVRFAEAVWRHWGNGLIDPAIVYDDPTKRIVRVTGTDLETNVTYSKDLMIEKTVERRQLKKGQQALGSRLNSYGDTVYLVEATEDDLLTKEAAQMAKCRRQLILQLVPGDLQDECLEAINRTLRIKAQQDPDAEKKKLLDAFDDLGIRVDQVKQFLDVRDLSGLTPKDLVALRGVYMAIRDGETNWREVMEQRDAARGTADAKPGTDQPAASTAKAAEILSAIHSNRPAAAQPAAQASQTPQDAPAPVESATASPKPAQAAQPASAPQENGTQASPATAPDLSDLFNNQPQHTTPTSKGNRK